MQLIFILLSTLQWCFVLSQRTFDTEKLKHWCISARDHKTEPGPESELYKQCTPWKDHACCTGETTIDIHNNERRYGIDRNHCGKLSQKCNEHFMQDLCFYDCEPNLGPWIVAVNQKMRKERFVEVPLCASDCNRWFTDCANDTTCVQNWIRDFKRENGNISCPPDKPCKTFKEIYQNASTFCEKIWDGSWKYTPDDQPCMRLWFNGSSGNPNVGVRDYRIGQLVAMWNSASAITASLLTLGIAVVVALPEHKF